MAETYVNVIKTTPSGERKMRFAKTIWDVIRKAKQPEGTNFRLADDEGSDSLKPIDINQKLTEDQVRDFDKGKLAERLQVDAEDFMYDELVKQYMEAQEKDEL